MDEIAIDQILLRSLPNIVSAYVSNNAVGREDFLPSLRMSTMR